MRRRISCTDADVAFETVLDVASKLGCGTAVRFEPFFVAVHRSLRTLVPCQNDPEPFLKKILTISIKTSNPINLISHLTHLQSLKRRKILVNISEMKFLSTVTAALAVFAAAVSANEQEIQKILGINKLPKCNKDYDSLHYCRKSPKPSTSLEANSNCIRHRQALHLHQWQMEV